MLIAGAGGLGIEVLGILIRDGYPGEMVFFDEDDKKPALLFGKYPVIKDQESLRKYFTSHDRQFVAGIGNPRIREKMTVKVTEAGGVPSTVISKDAAIFHFTDIPAGTIIQPGAGFSHGISLGEGCAVHINATVGHSCRIGKYVNIGPGATVIGPCEVGDYSYIGAQALIMPGLKIGKNAIIGAGARVDRNICDFESIMTG
ncbi:MAG: hypothetical protein ABIJ16_05405 [Bacteroidota bacterium]